ncbi:uncharacterized protein LOC130786907 isoform X2 [Actinidia eriantha]|uniref:uncharacterized protein LOC130786907 isoform X2 n=1 Tax=Actinidia eriantha TaxID=165200 RepID=UPI00258AC7C8|nr:uncharacterized protein LOC130786907 isoform X2 [Actinidia eriantha]
MACHLTAAKKVFSDGIYGFDILYDQFERDVLRLTSTKGSKFILSWNLEIPFHNRLLVRPRVLKLVRTPFQFVEGQEIKIQESTQLFGVGAIPCSIPFFLTDDLVDTVKTGGNTRLSIHADDVIVTGVLIVK